MQVPGFNPVCVSLSSGSRAERAKKIFMPLTAILLSIVVLTGFTEGVALLIGVGVTGFGLPIAAAVTVGWTALAQSRSELTCGWATWLFLVVVSLATIAASLLFSGRVLDDTWDAQWFHKEAIAQLADGWNPVHGPLTEAQVPDVDVRARIDGYAKGAWIWGASLYRLTQRIERAKAFTVPLAIAATTACMAALLLLTRLHLLVVFVCSVLTALNPVSVVETLNVQLDGPMSLLLIIMVASAAVWLAEGSRLALVTGALAAAAAASVKLTGPVFVLIIAFGLVGVAWVFGLLTNKSRDLIWVAPSAALLALTLTAGSFVTNWVFFGHPLYPVRGEAPINIVTAPPGNRFEMFIVSALSSSSVQVDDEVAGGIILSRRDLKVPFTWTSEDLAAFHSANIRIGGWGPLGGGLLLLCSMIGVAGLAVERRRFALLAGACVPIVASVVVIPVMWKARFVPQTWILVMLLTIWALETRGRRFIRLLGWLLLASVALNLSLIGTAHAGWVFRHSAQLKHQLLQLNLGREPLRIDFGRFRAVRLHLAELGVEYTEIDDPSFDLQTYLGRFPLELDQSGVSVGTDGGHQVALSWPADDKATSYRVEVIIPPPHGPGAGALTVVRRETAVPRVVVPLPSGPSNIVVSRCNRLGCGVAGVAGPFDVPPGLRSTTVIGFPENDAVVRESSTYLSWLTVESPDGKAQPCEVELSNVETGEVVWTRQTEQPWVHTLFSEDSAWRLSVRPIGHEKGMAATTVFQTAGVATPMIMAPSNGSSISADEAAIRWSAIAGSTAYELLVQQTGNGRTVARGIFETREAVIDLEGVSPSTHLVVRVRACLSEHPCRLGSEIGWGPWSEEAGRGRVELIVAP